MKLSLIRTTIPFIGAHDILVYRRIRNYGSYRREVNRGVSTLLWSIFLKYREWDEGREGERSHQSNIGHAYYNIIIIMRSRTMRKILYYTRGQKMNNNRKENVRRTSAAVFPGHRIIMYLQPT